MLSIARLAILVLSGGRNVTGIVHRGTSQACFVAWTVCRGRDGTGSHLGVASGASLAAALPEWTTAGALGVVVRRAGAIALLLLVVAGEKELNHGREEEKEDVADGDGKAGSVQAADIAPVAGTRCGLV